MGKEATLNRTAFGSKAFATPAGITIDNSGNIWVVDSGNSRVDEFNSSGSLVTKIGSYGYANGQFEYPQYGGDVAIDGSGNIWVTDTGNNRVQEFSSTGTWKVTIPSGCADSAFPACPASTANGQFSGPRGIHIDSSGNIWVVDAGNSRTEEFSSSGVYESQWGSTGSGNGQFNGPEDLAFDASGNMWVMDTGNSRVQEFNTGGTYLSQFGTNGNGNGQFSAPRGIVITGSISASCTLPWGGSLGSGDSVGAYSTSSVNPPSTCPSANSLSCNNGTLSCSTGNLSDCQYQSCASTCALPWGGYLASGDSVTAYLDSSEVYPTTCTSQPRTCTNGTLSGSYTNQSCTETGQPCNLPWGGQINDTQSVTAWQTSTANAPASCTSQLRTCNNGTLNGSYTNKNCTQVCNLTANQGGGSLNTSSPGNTATEYAASSAPTCTANTLTCSPTGLSCSTGNISGCQYDSCTVSPGDIFVVDYDPNDRVQVFDSSGTYLGKFGSKGSGDRKFGSPHGIAFDSAGNVWVSDDISHPMQEFSSTTYKYEGYFGSPGIGNGYLDDPEGFAIDSSGNFWIANYASDSIQKYTSSGAATSTYFGSYGAGNGQFGGGVEGIAIDSSGNLWVADTGNNRVQEFSSSGTWLQTIPASGCQTSSVPACPASSATGQFNTPWGIAIDSSGNIYVTDWFNDRVEKFNSSGVYQSSGSFGTSGSGNGQFIGPTGIAIDSNGNFWVSDEGNSRVEEFNSSGGYQSQFDGSGGGGKLSAPMGIAIH